MVINLKYVKGNSYDENFKHLIKGVKDKIIKGNDDFLMVCVGDTGTGKSNLSLHAYEEYYSLYEQKPENIDNIAFKESDFADRLDFVSKQEMPKFLCYDEANVNKRNSMKTWNKDLIDIYFSIRGKNIFHWWNNPSVEMLDKTFVKEKLNGLIYVMTKTKDRPRIYLFFRKEDLLKLLKNENDVLTLDVLKKQYHKAFFIGCFKKYNGDLYNMYLAKKEERMDDKISMFKDKYGTKEILLNKEQVMKRINIKRVAFDSLFKRMKDNGSLVLNKHYVVSAVGKSLFKEDSIAIFMGNSIRKRRKSIPNYDMTPTIYNKQVAQNI